MKVPRLRRGEASEGHEGQRFLRPLPSSAIDFELERFEYLSVGGESVLLRLSGSWNGPVPDGATLEVRAAGQTRRFEALPGGAPSAAGAWSAGFAVPSDAVTAATRYALRADGYWVPLRAPDQADLASSQTQAAAPAPGAAPPPATEPPTPARVEEDAAEARRERDRSLAELTARQTAAAAREEELTRQAAELSQRIETLQGELREARDEVASLRELREEASSLRGMVVDVQEERDRALESAERHEEEVRALHRRANEIARELDERTGTLAHLEQELAEARESATNRERELAELQTRLDDAAARIEQSDRRRDHDAEERARLEARIDEERARLEERAAEELTRLESRAAEAEAEARTAAEQLAEARREVTALQDRHTALETDIEPLRNALRETSAERDQLLVELRELRTAWEQDVEPKLAEVRRLESELGLERSARAELYEEARKLHAKQARHDDELRTIRGELEQSHAAAANFAEDRERREQELAQLRSELEDARKQREAAESRIEGALEEARTIREQALDEANSNREQGLQEARAARDEALEEARTAREHAEQAVADKERAEAIANAAKLAVGERKQDLDQMREELQRAQARVAELEEQLAGSREALRLGVGGRLWGAETAAREP